MVVDHASLFIVGFKKDLRIHNLEESLEQVQAELSRVKADRDALEKKLREATEKGDLPPVTSD
jgi:hypothetical protein